MGCNTQVRRHACLETRGVFLNVVSLLYPPPLLKQASGRAKMERRGEENSCFFSVGTAHGETSCVGHLIKFLITRTKFGTCTNLYIIIVECSQVRECDYQPQPKALAKNLRGLNPGGLSQLAAEGMGLLSLTVYLGWFGGMDVQQMIVKKIEPC